MKRQRPAARDARHAARIAPPVPVEYWSVDVLGRGLASHVSTSGLFIDGVLVPLPRGTRVGLRFSFSAGPCPIDMDAEVVRRTETGFAVRFLDPESDRLGAVLSTLAPASASERGTKDPA